MKNHSENLDFSQGTIIGGQYATKGEFPWAAFIQLRSSSTGTSARCAGSLINDRWDDISLLRIRCDHISRFIVTAAHCLVPDRDNFDNITVTLGENRAFGKG